MDRDDDSVEGVLAQVEADAESRSTRSPRTGFLMAFGVALVLVVVGGFLFFDGSESEEGNPGSGKSPTSQMDTPNQETRPTFDPREIFTESPGEDAGTGAP